MKCIDVAAKVNPRIISEYGRASDNLGSRTTIGEALDRIRTDKALMRMVERIRSTDDEDQQNKLKRNLPAVTWSGEFEKRNAAGLVQHSGVVVLDYDHVTSPEKLKAKMVDCPHVLGAFLSPRGNGLKVLMLVHNKGDHKAAYRACRDYSIEQGWPKLDRSGPDVCRLCFLSYDTKAYVAEEVTPLSVRASAPAPKVTADDDDLLGETVDAEKMLADLDRHVTGVELEDARAMLTVLDPACSYEEWMGVGMALHAQWGGGDKDEEACALYCEWSCGALWHGDLPENYVGDEDCKGKWESFGKRSEGADVTLRSLIKRAKDAGFQTGTLLGAGVSGEMAQDKRKIVARADAVNLKNALAAIKGATTVTELTGDVAHSITELELFDSSREAMLETFIARYKEISGTKFTKKAADDLTTFNYAREVTKQGCPEWAAKYIFCSEDEGAFINVDTMNATKCKSFNMLFSSRLITDVMKAQGKMHPYVMPTDLLVNADLVEKVQMTRYVPGEDRLFDQEGEKVLNRWIPSGVDAVDPMLWSEEEADAVDKWESHLLWLLGEEHAQMLTKFLAYVLQNPGERVRWAFFMRGPEGCGKTMVVNDLMAAVLGRSNVDVLDNSTLMHTSFNDWSDSRQLCIVEEVYVEGRAKWDVMNVLKPAITNETLSVNPKGSKKYLTRNVTSYIMSTNHANALPLAANDRRYYVCSTRWHGTEFLADLGGKRKATQYFIDLASAAKEHSGALKGWLMNIDLKGFSAHRAPNTQGKAQLVEMSKSDLQIAIDNALVDGDCPTVNGNAVELETLKTMLADAGEAPSGQLLGRILREYGYESVGRLEVGAIGSRTGTVKSFWAVKTKYFDEVMKAKNKAAALRKLCS